ncbi:ANTAR domain-containing protein [Tessaracoccus caeni]|uniref:ANTAR domain-containing protein n=1 Tax=Tessaracoccus caeni TaxID=3031239 RepID=UPI0023DCA7E0|nr:ANTAR domain-containing protein [Tessaracoccus caeni]MDF1488613.1 ANTAR domain-containing protein [Tessaracoccus caeni]
MNSEQFALPPTNPPLSAEEEARIHLIDADWRRAVVECIQDGVFLFDAEGTVIEMNQAFIDLLGYQPADGPYRPPYPWWPSEEEDPEGLAEVRHHHDAHLSPAHSDSELVLYRRDRSRVWVRSSGASIHHGSLGTTHLRVLRDITRLHEATERRAAAAHVARSFATVDELSTLLKIAEYGFELLFDGDCTIRLGDGENQRWFGDWSIETADSLPLPVRVGLDGQPSPDAVSLRPGILLLPPTPDMECRAWVQFPRPRRITVDEMVAADLLAAGLAAALQRILAIHQASDREAHLQVAVQSHRLIGQATGVLVERHRLVPPAAFERLRQASQRRNLKLRELATRVIESGLDPEDA